MFPTSFGGVVALGVRAGPPRPRRYRALSSSTQKMGSARAPGEWGGIGDAMVGRIEL